MRGRGPGRPRIHHVNAEEHTNVNAQADDSTEASHANGDHAEDDEAEPREHPPSKRRKVAPTSSKPPTPARALSPPWRTIVAEGPSSFVEGGRRKSSRTNVVPLELQPPSEKRQTRSNLQKAAVTKSMYGGASLRSVPSPASPSLDRPGKNRRHTISAVKPPSSQPDSPADANRTPTRRPGRPPNRMPLASPSAKFAPLKRRHTPGAESSPEKVARSPRQALHVRRHPETRRLARHSDPSGARTKREPGKARRRTTTEEHDDDDNPGEEEDDDDDDAEESGENDNDADDADQGQNGSAEVDVIVKTPRLKFRVNMPKVPITHPGHVPPPRKYPSFRDWLGTDDPLSGEEAKRMTEEDAKREARLRARIIEASRPGGLLSRERCSVYMPDAEEEPDRQYAHHDHLVAQALHFRKLMNQERRAHVNAARRLAHAAAAEWKRRQPKTEEEIRHEQYEANMARYKQVRRDLLAKWDAITADVHQRRLARWEEEQQLRGKQALNEMLAHSTQLLDARRTGQASGNATAEPSVLDSGDDFLEDEDDEAGHELGSAEKDDSNMSSSQSTSEDGLQGGGLDEDADLTVDQLRQKYGAITAMEQHALEAASSPPRETQAGSSTHPDKVDADHEHPAAEPSGDALGQPLATIQPRQEKGPTAATPLEDDNYSIVNESDESIDMEDDMGESDDEDDSDGSECSDEAEETDEEEQEEAGPGLLGFFGRDELVAKGPKIGAGGGAESGAASHVKQEAAEEDQGERLESAPQEQVHEEAILESTEHVRSPPKPTLPAIATGAERPLDVYHSSGDPSTLASPGTNATTKPSEMDSASSMGLHAESRVPSSITTPQPTYHPKTPIPSLLRGTLREYQHYGLDWLAGLYANGTNGILADEMGLGKTIQTIALLAHLACHHEAWGPHLIIVPTSVMLNWEMEFKKWCPGFKILTYYGNQDERRQKRKGWMDDDRWNVCITSYQLVLQDRQAFKKRKWHYMILDEAHNIKNFRSQRWQTLLTFKAKARLLLTGTPLQNNLTELWSLLFFLMPSETAEGGIRQFADLKEFSGWFKRSADQILEHGRDTMDEDDKRSVEQLHKVLRPYLLRRLKADVEKQMPAKHEHVVYCRLSKRQRFLYDGFMSLAQTRETLRSGNYLSIINCLMQLRKVCNHPDLFETRPIVTSFALPKAAVADYEIKELLVRRRLLRDDPMARIDLDFMNLTPVACESMSQVEARESAGLVALRALQEACKSQHDRIDWRLGFTGTSIDSALAHLENNSRASRLEELRHCVYLTALRSQRRPIYGHGLVERLTTGTMLGDKLRSPKRHTQLSGQVLSTSDIVRSMVVGLDDRAASMKTTIQKFACITPAVVATDLVPLTLTRNGINAVRQVASGGSVVDPFHEARVRLSIAFPDKRLLQYDCGKLQRLDQLLRQLQAGGHRALIFTQMTKVLDILEQFLNIHGHRYLRLDGATKVEQRQVLTDRFNNDPRILVFILSSRSGGLGINLTGADTVIFYDLDWNPAMDKQCQDRCHRIGQTRDVHIYRFVSEYTIESNILRKANQKQMLDDVVIQEGEFTTDYFNKMSVRDMLGDDAAVLDDGEDGFANAAMDRVFGAAGGSGGVAGNVGKVLEQVEDVEDIAAAKAAEKEIVQGDDVDFDDRSVVGSVTCKTPVGEDKDTPKNGNSNVAPPTRPSSTPGVTSPPTGSSAPPPPQPPPPDSTAVAAPPPLPPLPPTTPVEASAPPGDDIEPGVQAPEQAEEEEEVQPPHVDEYMIRFVEWDLREVPIAPATDKGKSKGKAGPRARGHR